MNILSTEVIVIITAITAVIYIALIAMSVILYLNTVIKALTHRDDILLVLKTLLGHMIITFAIVVISQMVNAEAATAVIYLMISLLYTSLRVTPKPGRWAYIIIDANKVTCEYLTDKSESRFFNPWRNHVELRMPEEVKTLKSKFI